MDIDKSSRCKSRYAAIILQKQVGYMLYLNRNLLGLIYQQTDRIIKNLDSKGGLFY